jgi:enoyl-CoA hydratase/carnithine racemase
MSTPVEHVVQPGPHGAVHTLTISNPAKLNVVGSAAIEALRAALATVSRDSEARVVVLRGAGAKAWIGGADIVEMAALDAAGAEAFIRRLHGVCRALRELPVPVIAAIRGWCLGAGLEIAACCDLRLAAAGSRFGMPEVRVGLPSVIEAAVLPRLIGAGRTRDLVLTGRVVDCEEAWRWGLVDARVPGEALDGLVQTRTGEILAGAPRALRLQKRLCRAWEELPLEEAVEQGVGTFADAFRNPEAREYLARFLNRKRSRP